MDYRTVVKPVAQKKIKSCAEQDILGGRQKIQ